LDNTGECTGTFFLKYLCQPAGATGFNIGRIKLGDFFSRLPNRQTKNLAKFSHYMVYGTRMIEPLVFSIEHNKSLPTRGVTTNALKCHWSLHNVCSMSCNVLSSLFQWKFDIILHSRRKIVHS